MSGTYERAAVFVDFVPDSLAACALKPLDGWTSLRFLISKIKPFVCTQWIFQKFRIGFSAVKHLIPSDVLEVFPSLFKLLVLACL